MNVNMMPFNHTNHGINDADVNVNGYIQTKENIDMENNDIENKPIKRNEKQENMNEVESKNDKVQDWIEVKEKLKRRKKRLSKNETDGNEKCNNKNNYVRLHTKTG